MQKYLPFSCLIPTLLVLVRYRVKRQLILCSKLGPRSFAVSTPSQEKKGEITQSPAKLFPPPSDARRSIASRSAVPIVASVIQAL